MHILQSNMRYIFISAFILFSGLQLQAQQATFQWSEISSNTNTGLQNSQLVFPTPDGFTVYSVENLGTQVYAPQAVYITRFNSEGEKGETIDFPLPKRKLAHATLLKVIEGASKLYVFSYIALKKDKKNTLYVQVYDNKLGTVLESKEIYTIAFEKLSASGFFKVGISEDKKTIGLLVNKPFVKKTKEQIEVLILDPDLNIRSNSSQSLSFDNDRAPREELFVENDATISIVKKTNIFKKEPITSVITIKGEKLTEKQVSAEKFYISDNKIVTINGKQYLLGFATDNAKPSVSMGGAKDKSFFIYSISEEKLIKNQGWNPEVLKKILGKGFIDLKVKDVLLHNEEIYLIGDCMSKSSKEIEGENFEYDYTYNFGPGVVVKLNTSGEVAYDTYVKYGERYKNNMNRLGAFKPVIRNNDVYLLGNEKLSILQEKNIVLGYESINAKAIVARKLLSDGSFSIVAFESGIVGGKGNVVDFAPTRTLQLDDTTFYVYAYGKKYHAFGKMVIN